MKHSQKPSLVSLILVTYNQHQFVREAVEGALAQTYSPLEIIISDDCSPDQTFEEIEAAIKNYSGPHEIIVNRNATNMGLGAHFHKAIGLSHGDWIVGASGDDISEPERISALVAGVMSENDAVAAACGWQRIDAQGNPLATSQPTRFTLGAVHRLGEYDWVDGFQRGVDTGIPGMCAMWHRSLFTDFPAMGEGIVGEDIVLGFRAYLTGSVVFISQSLLRYRTHDANVCGFSGDNEGWMEDRRIQFCRNSRASIEMNRSDYRHYLARNPEIHEDPRILGLIQYSLRVNTLYSDWWERGIFWRLRGLIYLARIGGIKKLKQYLPKLLSKPIYLWLMKVRHA